MQLASNVARRETRNRKGKNAFVSYTFEEYAQLCDKLTAQFCTWYAYELEPLYEFLRENDWSISGYHHQHNPKLYFDFVPFDFDTQLETDTIRNSFENALKFVEWLEEEGIPESYFSIWLSGSKGFHVEVAASAFDVGSPSVDILKRVKSLSQRVAKQLNIHIDDSLYSRGRLYRIPNSHHPKTGLFKTRIARTNFNWEYIENRQDWASRPLNDFNNFSLDPLENPILLPLADSEQKEIINSPNLVFDTSGSIINFCPKIQGLMVNPEGREMRRMAIGALMEAYGYSSAPEVERVYEAWEANPYMDERRMGDANHWKEEFDREGIFKGNRSCTNFGCDKNQKKICGTQYPSDHLMKKEEIKPIKIEEARALLTERLNWAVYEMDTPDVFDFDVPIGIGKTSGLIKILANDESLSTLYLCPTHELAEQVMKDMGEAGISDRKHIKSRVEMERKKELDCPFFEEIRLGQGSNINIAKLICSKCDKFPANIPADSELPKCEYYCQFEDSKTTRVVVGVHNHANPYTFEQVGMKNRSFLVIDESPIDAFSGEIAEVSYEIQVMFRTFANQVISELSDELEGRTAEGIEALPGLFGAIRAQDEAERAATLLDAHQTTGASLAQRRSIARFIYTAIRAVIFDVELKTEDIEFLAMLNYMPQWIAFCNRMIEVARYERALRVKENFRHLVFPDILSNLIRCTGRLGQVYTMGRSYYYPTLMPENKVIILDATSSKDLYAKLVEVTCPPDFEREFHHFKLPLVEQTQAHITQITNSGYSKTRINSSDGLLDKLTFVVKSLRTTFPEEEMLCVSVLELEKVVKADVDASARTRFEHFKNMRGKNEYANYPLQVVIGSFFISNTAVIQGLNRLGIYNITESMLEAATVTIRNRHIAADGDSYFSQRKAYRIDSKDSPLKYANLILEQNAVAEIVQSVRIRLFSGNPDKRCFVLSNIGLSTIYANKFVTLEELTTELEDLSGIKSDLDTTKYRRDSLMFAKLNNIEIGAQFILEDIGENNPRTQQFITKQVKNGVMERIAPKTFIKRRDIRDTDTSSGFSVKLTKPQIFAKMDKWFESLSRNAEFTSSDLSEVAETESVRYLSEWINSKIDEQLIVRVGERRGTRYKKMTLMFGSVKL